MKKIFLIIFTILFASPTFAVEVQSYIKGAGSLNRSKAKLKEISGVRTSENSEDDNWGGEAGIGVNINDMFEIGLLGGYKNAEFSSNEELQILSLSLEGRFLVELGPVQPYLGASLNYGEYKYKLKNTILGDFEFDDKAFSASVLLGTRININDHIGLDVYGRYTPEIDIEGSDKGIEIKGQYEEMSLNAGLIFKF